MSNISSIRLSGTTYALKDNNATKTVELTQAQYDALTTKDPNTFYIITDAQGGDLSDYYTKSETDDLLDEKLDVTAYTPTDLTNYYTKSETSGSSQISTALNAKQETLVSGTNIKTINNESILGSGNIEIQGGGGGLDEDFLQATANALYELKTTDDEINEKFGDYYTKAISDGKYATNASVNRNYTSKEYIDDKMLAISASLNELNGNFGGLKLVKLTQSEYDALTVKDENTLYIIN